MTRRKRIIAAALIATAVVVIYTLASTAYTEMKLNQAWQRVYQSSGE